MNLSDKEIIELADLCDRLVENNLSYEQKKRLEKWLSDSAEAREFYISYTDMTVSLGYYADESLADYEDKDVVRFSDNFVRILQYWIPVAALIIFGIYLYSILPSHNFESVEKSAGFSNTSKNHEKNSEFKYQNASLPTVAVLTKSVGLSWQKDSQNIPDNGSALEAGSFSFKNGMAQLEFLQGTTAILEGPVETNLIDGNALSLMRGKLRAHVPKVAIGFTVDLPMGQVIDLGTDFGIHVYPEGAAEVFVFRGKVKYQGSDLDGNEVSRQLSTGEAIYLDPYGELTPLDMPTGNFVGSADLASRSLENASRRRIAWLGKSQELASSSRTLLYYGFENHAPWARVLKDETDRENGSGDGAVIGCNWSEGRWPGKGALQFSQDNDRVCFNMNQPLSTVTLAAWVRLDSLGDNGAPLFSSKPNLPGALTWSVSSDGKLVLEIKTSTSFEKYESAVAFAKNRMGKWTHLVTTFDGEEKWVNHFINGRSFSRERIDLPKLLRFKKGLLGHFQALPNQNPTSLRGSIDEFAIFDSVWEEKDIRQLYEVGCPQKQTFTSINLFP